MKGNLPHELACTNSDSRDLDSQLLCTWWQWMWASCLRQLAGEHMFFLCPANGCPEVCKALVWSEPCTGEAASQVVAVDVGSSVPMIHNVRALPTPTTAIWPQVMFDLHYTGAWHAQVVTQQQAHCSKPVRGIFPERQACGGGVAACVSLSLRMAVWPWPALGASQAVQCHLAFQIVPALSRPV